MARAAKRQRVKLALYVLRFKLELRELELQLPPFGDQVFLRH